jgi:hypothetical protein
MNERINRPVSPRVYKFRCREGSELGVACTFGRQVKAGIAVVNRLPKIMYQTLASEPMKIKDTSVATKIVTEQIRVTSSTLVIGDRTVSRIKLVILRGEISRDIYGIS